MKFTQVLVILAFAAFVSSRDVRQSRGGRIVGGETARPGQFPFTAFAFVNLTYGQLTCGASLLNSRTVMLAAHCVDTNEYLLNVEVLLGAHNRNIFEPSQLRIIVPASQVTQHQNYKIIGMDHFVRVENDIALIDLGVDVQFTDRIRPLPLVPKAAVGYNFAGQVATIIGWGIIDQIRTEPDELRFVNNTIITNDACEYWYRVLNSNICVSGAEGKASCNGDSGGPVVAEYNGQTVQVGIVSFGSSFGCDWEFPSVFVRVTEYIPWIEANSNVRFP